MGSIGEDDPAVTGAELPQLGEPIAEPI